MPAHGTKIRLGRVSPNATMERTPPAPRSASASIRLIPRPAVRIAISNVRTADAARPGCATHRRAASDRPERAPGNTLSRAGRNHPSRLGHNVVVSFQSSLKPRGSCIPGCIRGWLHPVNRSRRRRWSPGRTRSRPPAGVISKIRIGLLIASRFSSGPPAGGASDRACPP